MGVHRKGYKLMFSSNVWKIVKGDNVMITMGKDKSKTGTVVKVLRDQQWPRVIVEGLNLSKRWVKKTEDRPGHAYSVERPIHYSNVQLVDPITGAPVRSVVRYLETGERVRESRGKNASRSLIPFPQAPLRSTPRKFAMGPLDTPLSDVAEITHRFGDLPSFLRQVTPHVREPAQAGGEAAA